MESKRSPLSKKLCVGVLFPMLCAFMVLAVSFPVASQVVTVTVRQARGVGESSFLHCSPGRCLRVR